MRTLKIYSLNHFHLRHRAGLIIVILLNTTFLVLIYLVPGSLYLSTTFIQFSPSPATSGNHRADLFFYNFVCLSVFEVQLSYNPVSFWCVTQQSSVSVRYKMVTTTSLVTICHHTKMLHYPWLHSPCCTFHPCDSSVLELEVCTCDLPHLSRSSSSPPFPPTTPSLFSVPVTRFCFVCSFLDSNY